MTITMDSGDREWIKQAMENDKQALIDGIKTIYNCREADVDADGNIWIGTPQSGHWLEDDGLERVARALKSGDI